MVSDLWVVSWVSRCFVPWARAAAVGGGELGLGGDFQLSSGLFCGPVRPGLSVPACALGSWSPGVSSSGWRQAGQTGVPRDGRVSCAGAG